MSTTTLKMPKFGQKALIFHSRGKTGIRECLSRRPIHTLCVDEVTSETGATVGEK